MPRHPIPNLALSAILTAGLAVLLALALGWSFSAAATPPLPDGVARAAGEDPGEDVTVFPAHAPAAAGKPGVITWTFDADNMGWVTRDLWTATSPAAWADGYIIKDFTNDDDHFPDFARFESPWFTELAGSSGTLSFYHGSIGSAGGVLYSVCIVFSGRDWIPVGTLPCTPWHLMTSGHVEIPLSTAGEWAFSKITNVPALPPPWPTPLTQQEMEKILRTIRQVRIQYVMAERCKSWDRSCTHTSATVALDDIRLETIGVSGELYASTPNVMDGDAVLFYATVKDADGVQLKASGEVTMTLGEDTTAWNLWDVNDPPLRHDLGEEDGVHSHWLYPMGEGEMEAKLFYRGQELNSTTITVMQHPRLAVVTDIQALYDEFRDQGMALEQDEDGDGQLDFYQLLGELYDYAGKHKGIVYDVRHSIDPDHDLSADYASLTYAGSDPSSNRIRMGKLIDEALSRLHRLSGHTIGSVALIGGDGIIPFYRLRDPSATNIQFSEDVECAMADDMEAGYLVTDLPYGTVDHVNQDAVARPVPQIGVGRVADSSPAGLMGMLSAYGFPIVFEEDHMGAALFTRSGETKAWDWATEHVWEPVLEAKMRRRDIISAPPFEPGFYTYRQDEVGWERASVMDAMREVNLTILSSHGKALCTETSSVEAVCGAHYGVLPAKAGTVHVIQTSFSGLQPPPSSPGGDEGAFFASIALGVQHIGRTFLGNSGMAYRYANAKGVSEYLMSHFVDEAVNGGSGSVGRKFVEAYDGYWSSAGADRSEARTAAYSMILWGLPTQPIQTVDNLQSQVAAVEALAPAEGVEPAGAAQAATAERSFVTEVNVPNFRTELDAQGAALISPANGGGTFTEGPGWPLLPQVVQRFTLPAGANNVRVVEDAGARVAQSLGVTQLQITQLLADCAGMCTAPATTPPVALTQPYPSASFAFDVREGVEATSVTLRVVPAVVQPDGQVTLFSRMKFTVSYSLPQAPKLTITSLALNNGQAVRAGSAAVPLAVNITSDVARPVTVTYRLGDPSGFTAGSGEAAASVPAGASRVNLTLDAARWAAGPKTLSASIVDISGTLDAASMLVQVLGLRLEADMGTEPVTSGFAAPLKVQAWDENGAASGGLAGRFTVSVDGAPNLIAFSEGPIGHYAGSLSTGGMDLGRHQVVVTASDSRGLMAEAWTGFTVAPPGTRAYLPLTLR